MIEAGFSLLMVAIFIAAVVYGLIKAL